MDILNNVENLGYLNAAAVATKFNALATFEPQAIKLPSVSAQAARGKCVKIVRQTKGLLTAE